MTLRVARPATPADVIVLQYANPTRMLAVPLCILLAVVVVMTGVTIAVVGGGGSARGLDDHGAVIWSLFGFMVAAGVQAVTTAFPIALALGATRRTCTLGTLATSALQAAAFSTATLLLLGLETATGGWFVGAKVLGDATLGGGDPITLITVMFLATLTSLAVGSLFGASWVRFGPRGPMALGIGIALMAVAALLAFPPDFAALGRSFEPWWLAAAAGIAVVLSALGEYGLLRRTSVR